MEKKIRKVIKFEDLPEDALEELSEEYPDGWKDHVKKIVKPNGDTFHAINLELENVSYLVKIEVKVDAKSDKLDESILDKEAEKEAIKDAKEDIEQGEGDND
ncbi:MAG: hypothetical protein K8R86_00385 [Bacteroidales bacterium]|nr:hypothetical protein [Bacteroidales bacterium]